MMIIDNHRGTVLKIQFNSRHFPEEKSGNPLMLMTNAVRYHLYDATAPQSL